MSIISTIGAKLDQSSRLMDNLGVSLAGSSLATEHDVRNVIWRCILCRHGEECRDWIRSGSREVPEFCANRQLFRLKQQAN